MSVKFTRAGIAKTIAAAGIEKGRGRGACPGNRYGTDRGCC